MDAESTRTPRKGLAAGAANRVPVVGIVGGTGGMGGLFSRFFRRRGCRVLVAGRTTSLTPEALASKSDFVFVSVPITKTIPVIRKIAPFLKPGAVLSDFTSLKSDVVKEMLAVTKNEVVGCHPVFGPGVKSLSRQAIVLCPGRGKAGLAWLRAQFEAEGACVTTASAEEHDRVMAWVQALVHVTSISFVHAMRSAKVSPELLRAFSSPVYRLRMDLAARILDQNAELYSGIAIGNPASVDVLDRYRESFHLLAKSVRGRKAAAFEAMFREAAEWLGKGRAEAAERTDRLIAFEARQGRSTKAHGAGTSRAKKPSRGRKR